MKTWAIWNRNYKRRDFQTETVEEALALAKAGGHIRKTYRKFKDVTDQ